MTEPEVDDTRYDKDPELTRLKALHDLQADRLYAMNRELEATRVLIVTRIAELRADDDGGAAFAVSDEATTTPRTTEEADGEGDTGEPDGEGATDAAYAGLLECVEEQTPGSAQSHHRFEDLCRSLFSQNDPRHGWKARPGQQELLNLLFGSTDGFVVARTGGSPGECQPLQKTGV